MPTSAVGVQTGQKPYFTPAVISQLITASEVAVQEELHSFTMNCAVNKGEKMPVLVLMICYESKH